MLIQWSAFQSASHAALWTSCHGVRSHPVPVALVGRSCGRCPRPRAPDVPKTLCKLLHGLRGEEGVGIADLRGDARRGLVVAPRRHHCLQVCTTMSVFSGGTDRQSAGWVGRASRELASGRRAQAGSYRYIDDSFASTPPRGSANNRRAAFQAATG